ncbi:putative sugar ABC transporter, ATP-binding protein [Burkholderia pseudomallei ABCPW 107]|nr:putative sugar ABC transporter, ATP-binding protein [Burkholderia pseudomallei]KGS36884.1 putative sugar ABC transporter, ATP-binding protein [Burkholderia pseudomallei ABCPW 107]CAJ6525035.1 Uncharacterised protein [Burkholderia pseudomallei]CAJ9228405.1 Uncharacterised protein [Burkholderia pseudomallei]CAJ9271425.1 Uncharacterised protein [Burkholderia pseudomallei]
MRQCSSSARASRRSARQSIAPRFVGCRLMNRFSATVSSRMIVECWYTHATRARQPSRSASGGAASPAKRTTPASGLRSPVRIDTSVDLPAPLRPTSACDSPARTHRSTSASAMCGPKRFVSARASTTGAPASVQARAVTAAIAFI